jgi:hypothetical protein
VVVVPAGIVCVCGIVCNVYYGVARSVTLPRVNIRTDDRACGRGILYAARHATCCMVGFLRSTYRAVPGSSAASAGRLLPSFCATWRYRW